MIGNVLLLQENRITPEEQIQDKLLLIKERNIPGMLGVLRELKCANSLLFKISNTRNCG